MQALIKKGPGGRGSQGVHGGDEWSRGNKNEEMGLWDAGGGSGGGGGFELADFAKMAEQFRVDTADKGLGQDAKPRDDSDDPLERLMREDAAAIAEREALEDDSVPSSSSSSSAAGSAAAAAAGSAAQQQQQQQQQPAAAAGSAAAQQQQQQLSSSAAAAAGMIVHFCKLLTSPALRSSRPP